MAEKESPKHRFSRVVSGSGFVASASNYGLRSVFLDHLQHVASIPARRRCVRWAGIHAFAQRDAGGAVARAQRVVGRLAGDEGHGAVVAAMEQVYGVLGVQPQCTLLRSYSACWSSAR